MVADRATGPGAPCWWCGKPIPPRSVATGRKTRADAKTCSKVCRQADWRFGQPNRAHLVDATDRPMRFAYADPPYPGMSFRYYGDHRDFQGEVDHVELVARLCRDYPDGWALSTSSKTMREVLNLCPLDCWVGVWTKPTPPRFSRRPTVAWEPVIFRGGRPLKDDGRTIRDWCYAVPPRTHPEQIVGIKPSDFSWWVFDCLGALPIDELDDLYRGSGAVSQAWDRYRSSGTGGKRRERNVA